ncbi:MFS general substrate transporter [Amylocystis lapponica]|nr:MFS general substrate transporter [Amylocystis lapponica]
MPAAVLVREIAPVHREDILTGQQEDTLAVSQSQTLHRPLEETIAVQELPPVDRGRRAWMFCASAFLLDLMIWGYSTSYGIFQVYYTTHPPFENTSSVGITATGTICIGLMYGEAILVSLAAGRYPDYVKPAMWVGLGLVCLSLLASSFATKVWHLILLQGIGVGAGGGLLYWPIVFFLPQWFVVRRGLAAGLIFSGSGAGGFLFPLLLNVMLERVGVQWALRIWALAIMILSGIALLGVNPRLPVPRYTSENRRPRFIPLQLDFLKGTLFWAFSITTILQALSFFPVSLYIATFATLVSSPLSATVVLSVFNVASVVGQVLIGHLCDRFPYAWIMFVSALGSGITAFLLWGFADTLARVFAFAIVFGGLSGGFSSVGPIGSSDCVGEKLEQTRVAYGIVLLFKGAAVVIGPVVSGVLYDAGSAAYSAGNIASYGSFGFGPMELFVGACSIATSLGSVVVAIARSRRAMISAGAGSWFRTGRDTETRTV